MKAAPAVVVVKSYDEPVVAFEGKFEDPEITTFVELSTSPKLVEMDQYVHTSCTSANSTFACSSSGLYFTWRNGPKLALSVTL